MEDLNFILSPDQSPSIDPSLKESRKMKQNQEVERKME